MTNEYTQRLLLKLKCLGSGHRPEPARVLAPFCEGGYGGFSEAEISEKPLSPSTPLGTSPLAKGSNGCGERIMRERREL